MSKLFTQIKERTGIYASGINPNSAAGFLLPGIFVIVVGGALATWIIMG